MPTCGVVCLDASGRNQKEEEKNALANGWYSDAELRPLPSLIRTAHVMMVRIYDLISLPLSASQRLIHETLCII